MPLTTAQTVTLKAAILAETDPTFVALRTAGATGAMADWFNQASTFTVWRTSVPISEIGDAVIATELVGLTALNLQRLQALTGDLAAGSINASIADRRSGFDQVFSGAGGAGTRAALLVLWKRLALRIEKLYATGTGTNATPGTVVYEGTIRDADFVLAFYS